MKNKAPLPFMEQILMLLVFAITAALCLQGFAAANKISLQKARLGEAVLLAQNAAEILKATSGDYEALADIPLADNAFFLSVTPQNATTPYLGTANIQIYYETEFLFQITVAWQEVT